MTDALLDALWDTARLIPFLFLTYLAMEYIEHRAAAKTREWIRRAGRSGPLLGAAVGLFPQCGFSAAAANLYAARLISRGTLIAVFLATSDEMLPILISEAAGAGEIFKLLGIKFIAGVIVGFLVDLAGGRLKKDAQPAEPHIHELCEHEHCDCEAGILPSALRHTVNITVFLFLATVILNLAIFYLGEDSLAAFMENRPFVSVLLAALVGLIPNCAPSVLLTQLYLQGALRLGAAMAGLLASSGVGILVLFRMNPDRRESLKIAAIVYIAGAAAGLLLEWLF